MSAAGATRPGPVTKLVVRTGLVVVTAAVAQLSLFSAVPIAGVRLPLLLLVAVAGGIELGAPRGAAVGFAAGLWFDLLLTTPLGLCAGVFAVAAHVAARARPRPPAPSPPWWRGPAAVAATSSGAYLTVVVAGTVLGGRPLAPRHLAVVLAVVAAGHAALAPLALGAMRWAGAPGEPRLPARLRGTGRGR